MRAVAEGMVKLVVILRVSRELAQAQLQPMHGQVPSPHLLPGCHCTCSSLHS